MRFMILLKADADTEAGVMPESALITEMMKYNEELVKAGVMRGGEGLQATSKGARVHFAGAQRTVARGPFPETKQLISGFWIFEVKSLDEAIEWVKRCPNPMDGESEIEIRQVYELDDFAGSASGEAREVHERVRDALTERQG